MSEQPRVIPFDRLGKILFNRLEGSGVAVPKRGRPVAPDLSLSGMFQGSEKGKIFQPERLFPAEIQKSPAVFFFAKPFISSCEKLAF